METTNSILMDKLMDEWNSNDTHFSLLEEDHRKYVSTVDELSNAQVKCQKDIKRQRTELENVSKMIDSIQFSNEEQSELNANTLEELRFKIHKKGLQLREMDDLLPHENGIYLKIVLGSVNVSLLSKRDKYKYKQNYEHFKLYVTLIILIIALVLWFFLNYRVTDAIFQFLLVWYYCTLTVREHILKMNGSRIKGWWITHHFISTACAGLFLIWPDGFSYHFFRPQYLIFSIYLTIVQLTQYYYQTGSLYRLRALGERRNMDITVDGFQSWMWRGLTFLFPLLIIAYIFQLHNAYTLIKLSLHPQCLDWQVFVLGIIFFILFLGNTSTIAYVISQKSMGGNIGQGINKYKYHAQTPMNSRNISKNSSFAAFNEMNTQTKNKSKDQ